MSQPIHSRTRTKLSASGGHEPNGDCICNHSAGIWTASPTYTSAHKATDTMTDEVGGRRLKKPMLRFRELHRTLNHSAPWYVSYPVHVADVALTQRWEGQYCYVETLDPMALTLGRWKPDKSVVGYQYNPVIPDLIPTQAGQDVTAEFHRARLDAWLALVHEGSSTNQMNSLRAVCELKDAGTMKEQTMDFIWWCKLYKKAPAKWRRYMVNTSVSMKFVARCYLSWKFGIEPTVKDLKRFISECTGGVYRLIGVADTHHKQGEILSRDYNTRLRYPQGYHESGSPASEYITTPGNSTIYGPCGVFGGFEDEGAFNEIPRFTSYASVSDIGRLPTSIPGFKAWYEWQYKGKVFCQVTKEWFSTAGELLLKRFQWASPFFTTKWELIPLSFVLQWWLNVSAVLNRLDKLMCPRIDSTRITKPWYTTRLTRTVSVPRVSDLTTLRLYHHSWVRRYIGGKYWYYEKVGLRLESRYIADYTPNVYHDEDALVYSATREPYVVSADITDPTVWTPLLKTSVKAYQLTSLAAMFTAKSWRWRN